MRYISPEKVVRGHLGNNLLPQWDIAIMCFHSIEKTNKIVEYFSGRRLGYRIFSKCNEDFVFETSMYGKKIGILGWCTGGGPLTASLIEELSVLNVKYIIGIGAAAAIVPKLYQRQIVIPTELLVNDGTSKCYELKNLIHIEQEMYSIIQKSLHITGIDAVLVKGATIEALYRQSEEILEPLRDQGCQIVNWELTPFYAATNLCSIKSVWIGHISDIELEERWENWYINREDVTENTMRLCKKVIGIISEDNNENQF